MEARGAATKRLHYIDWLRVLAVLLLFPFHTSRVFNYGDPFYIKSIHLSMPLNYVLAFIDRWHMPLLFLLAGASTYFSLKKRTPSQYAAERATRLLVPLAFGILVIVPPQTWVGAQFNSGYTGSYWQYITSGAFLTWNIQEAGDYYGGFGIAHLWFILFLFLISMIVLPLLIWGRGDRGRARLQASARRLARPAWWLLPPFVLYLAEGLFPAVAGKNLGYYLVYFVLGFIAISDEEFTAAAERRRWIALALGVAICGAYVAVWSWRDSLADPSWSLTTVNYLGMLGNWLMLIGLLGVGKHYLDRGSRSLSYLAEGSYPIYILHQTVIVVLAFWLVRLPVGGVVQWLLLLVTSIGLTFALYEGIRRVGPLRFLFGMRSQRGRATLHPVS